MQSCRSRLRLRRSVDVFVVNNQGNNVSLQPGFSLVSRRESSHPHHHPPRKGLKTFGYFLVRFQVSRPKLHSFSLPAGLFLSQAVLLSRPPSCIRHIVSSSQASCQEAICLRSCSSFRQTDSPSVPSIKFCFAALKRLLFALHNDLINLLLCACIVFELCGPLLPLRCGQSLVQRCRYRAVCLVGWVRPPSCEPRFHPVRNGCDRVRLPSSGQLFQWSQQLPDFLTTFLFLFNSSVFSHQLIFLLFLELHFHFLLDTAHMSMSVPLCFSLWHLSHLPAFPARDTLHASRLPGFLVGPSPGQPRMSSKTFCPQIAAQLNVILSARKNAEASMIFSKA